MSQLKSIQWLYEQLPELVDQGILSAEAAERLRAHYGAAEPRKPFQLAFIIAAVLGAVLIGGGIILIFAYNWESLSRGWRTFFSLLPLVIAQMLYGYTFYRQSESVAWVEATSAFLMLMVGASIALISQTYNIIGSLEGFLLVWMLLSLPLMYLMNATLVALFYLVGIMSWTMNVEGSISVFYWLLLLAALPHVYRNSVNKWSSPRAYWLGWLLLLTLIGAYFNVIETDVLGFILLGPAFLISLCYLIGARLYPQDMAWMPRPFQTLAVICLFIMCIILCYGWPNEDFYFSELVGGQAYAPWAGGINFAVLLFIIAAGSWQAFKAFQADLSLNWLVPALPLMVFFGMLLSLGNMEVLAMILANLYLLVLGIYYIKMGIDTHRLALVNLGMLFIAIQITARFFSTDLSPLIKGIIFVLLGACFLAANWYLTKRLKTVD
ncbi:MAG: DUF2157 domain-containing protein [Bacteroidota bacterium]